jgi:hypothetical protein
MKHAENVIELAQRFYNAYGVHADWKSWNGNPMPQWDELNEAVQSHWIAVAQLAIDELW